MFPSFNTHIFANNKYTTWYFLLINKAQKRLEKLIDYERHHIVPESLGGSLESSNIVMLTYREHYIAHLLLTKAVVGTDAKYKMLKAIKFMMHIGNEKFGLSKNGKKYENTKKILHDQFSKAMSAYMIEQHKNFPEKFKKTLNSRKQISLKLSGENNGMFSKNHSDEAKEKIRRKRIGKISILKNGKKIFISPNEIDEYFNNGWIPNPKAIQNKIIDSRFLDVEKYESEFDKWKNRTKMPKSRIFR